MAFILVRRCRRERERERERENLFYSQNGPHTPLHAKKKRGAQKKEKKNQVSEEQARERITGEKRVKKKRDSE